MATGGGNDDERVHDELVARSALKSESMVNDYLLNEAQHLVFHDQSGPSMIQKRSVPRSLRPSSKGLSGPADLESLSRREKAMKKYLSKDKDKKEKKKPKKDKKDRSDRSSAKSTKSSSSNSVGSDMSDFNPVAGSPVSYLLQELRKIVPEGTAPRTCQCLKMVGIFSEWTTSQKAAYDKDAIAAIRGRNLDLMRTWVASGRTMQAANSFGESLLHMACRRGFLDVVQFLVDECGHDLWIRDDTGRTPLHDACWTAEPCPELVDYILAKECDMLLVSDKRGHTPLDYARKDHWDFWIEYLKAKDLTTLLPKRESFYTSAESSVPMCQNLVIVENLDMFMKNMKLEDEAQVKSRRRDSAHGAILEEDGGDKSDHSKGTDVSRRKSSRQGSRIFNNEGAEKSDSSKSRSLLRRLSYKSSTSSGASADSRRRRPRLPFAPSVKTSPS